MELNLLIYYVLELGLKRAATRHSQTEPRRVAEPELPELDYSVLAAIVRPKSDRRHASTSRSAKPARAAV